MRYLKYIMTGFFLPLFLGGCCYGVRLTSIATPHTYPSSTFILYSLPDGLWLYAFLSALKVNWQRSTFGYYWYLGSIVAALLTELLQKLHGIPGTYDPKDILAYLLASLTWYNFHFTDTIKIPQI